MKKILHLLIALLCTVSAVAQDPTAWKSYEGNVNFILANDLGRNGYYEQKPLAELMGKMAEEIDISAVVAAGDVHHFEGVRSTADPLWLTNYEWVYAHPELMLPWYPILGNHEYRGSTQAVLDYSRVSRRWCMPARYYSQVLEEDGVSIRLILLDTAPLIDKYRKDTLTYPDACKQDREAQLRWLDSELSRAKETWVIVIGHHPIYADTPKSESERSDMQRYVDPILRKHDNVAMYCAGHIHNFQHIRKKGSNTDYIVNSAASLSRRKVAPMEGTVFCSGEAGFSIISATPTTLYLRMIDGQGKAIHTVERRK